MQFSMSTVLALLVISSPYFFQTPAAFSTSASMNNLLSTRNRIMQEKTIFMALEGVELLKTQSNYLQDPLKDVR